MEDPTGKSADGPLRLAFDRRLRLEFRGSRISSDAGLLAYRELDDALGLSAMATEMLADARIGKNGRHALVGLLNARTTVANGVGADIQPARLNKPNS